MNISLYLEEGEVLVAVEHKDGNVVLHVQPPQQLLHRPRPRQPPPRPPLEAAAPALPPLPAGQDLHVDELEVADLALAAAPPQSASVHTVIGRGGRVRNRGTVAYSMLEDLIYRKNCDSA